MTSSLCANSYLPQGAKTLTKCQQLASHLTERAEIATRLSRRYEELLRSEKFCDCQFNVVNTKIRGHKIILAAASPVFEAMFFGPAKENDDEINIDDIGPDIFHTLIIYIYTGSWNFEEMSLEETIELYYSAEKYLLNELIDDCLMAVTKKLRFDNILPALELSVCINLNGLMNVCMSFFTRCCLGDAQYMSFMKTHSHHHVSKDCIKSIIAANKEFHSQLLWFVLEWCQQECQELGLEKTECELIMDDLEFEKTALGPGLNTSSLIKQASPARYQTIERTYYKACRPFVIDCNTHTWKFALKSERFISLHGFMLQGRLMPNILPAMAAAFGQTVRDEYNENLTIEIRLKGSAANELAATENNSDTLVWRHVVSNQAAKYNCDLNINWKDGVVLSPDVIYEVILSWCKDAYRAEYPCSLMSNIVDGIEFRDSFNFFGSIVKGLSYVNLV